MTIRPFNRLVRRVLVHDRDGRPHIDSARLARELASYSAEVQEEVRLAALQAIQDKLAEIAARRKKDPEC